MHLRALIPNPTVPKHLQHHVLYLNSVPVCVHVFESCHVASSPGLVGGCQKLLLSWCARSSGHVLKAVAGNTKQQADFSKVEKHLRQLF